MSKALVAYFFTSGVTAKLAKLLTDTVDADLHEVRPERPHSNADLDWMNKKSRSSVGTNNKPFHPTIASKVENMEQYNRVFVGLPIWWCMAPMIINTFLGQYGLTGKRIIPFVISGNNGMGNTNAEFMESYKGAVLYGGRRFNTNVKTTGLKARAENF